MRHLRLLSLTATMAVSTHGSVLAQSVTVPGAEACGRARMLVGGVGGAVIGGFVGLVFSKIKISDWEAGSGGAPAAQARNQYIAGGAVLGAVAGALFSWSTRCARSGGEGVPGAVPPPRRSMNEITVADIQRFGATGSVYDLIASLRRNWLIVRGAEPAAYVNETKIGGLDALRELPSAGVTGVRFYDAAQATQRFGAGHMSGAIQVLTAGVANGR